MKNLNLFLVAFVFVFMNTLSAFAGPNRTTYQAKIVKPDGYPLESSNVNFKFTILDPAGNCILYSETYSSVNMSSTGGLISFSLGSGVKTYPVSATTFEQVFSNITPSLSCDTGGPTDYTPAASDTRKIVMQFHDGNGWQTLPAMSINAVPYAMFANDAQKLNGKTDTDFVQVTAMPTCTTDEALYYNGTSFTCVSTATVSAAAVVSALGYTPADGASVTALTSSLSTTDATVSSVSSTVASVSSTVFSVSATVSGLSASMAAITSSQWASSGSTISYNSGFVGVGTTTPVTKLDVSGGLRIGVESATCAAGLAGTIRYNSGNVEFCNGTSWSAFGVAGAGITLLNGSASGSQIFATGVTGTVFNISSVNGVHTFNIPLAASSSVTAGLLSNSDYATFTNKLNATSAAVISVLGFTPANEAALGTLATLNFIDLSSSQASGTLAAAKLPAFSGDVSSSVGTSVLTLANVGSGVTSGTEYTKVTVDGKGRVTSGAQLSVSDVTTALGYTPASASASTQWVTSGTTISYSTGNVGIGTSNPISRLTITDGQVVSASLSTTDYALFAAQNTAPTFSIVTADSASSPTSRSVFKGVRARGTLSSPLPPQVDDHVLSFLGSIYDGSSTQGSAMVSFLVDGAVSPGVAPQRISFFTSLTGAASRTEKLTIKSDGKIGVGTTTPVTRLEVSGGVKISMESATCAVSYAGTLRYNTGNVEYCNGTTWSAFGVSGAGLQSFNGSTSGTQSFANGTAGTAPLFATANGVHTLNIPLASAGSVTAGLISNADYTSFSNKITSSAASIAQVLGYVPASATALGNYLVRTNNLSDLTSSESARTNLGLGTFATANTIDLGSASATGTLAVARLPAFNGDATIAAASNTIVLANSGVTAGTYNKVTVDAKGRVTSSAALASNDVTTALGYTPASASASTQWATSGTTINYMTGDVGVGTIAPAGKLDINGTTLSNGLHLGLARTFGGYGAIGESGDGVKGRLIFGSDGTDSAEIYSRIDGNNTGLVLEVKDDPNDYIDFRNQGSSLMRIFQNGNVGVGITAPNAKLQLASGTAATAPLKFTSGTLLSAAQAGAMEFDGSAFYLTDGAGNRRVIAAGANPSTIDDASYINSTGNITMTPVGSVVVSSTTASTNSATGALIVNGGAGIAGNLNVSGTISSNSGINLNNSNDFILRAAASTPNDPGDIVWRNSDASERARIYSGTASSPVINFSVGSSPSTKMTILENGNVGIGTTAPSSYGHGGTNKFIEIQNSGTSINSQSHLILTTGVSEISGSSVGSLTWAQPNVSTPRKEVAWIGSVTESASAAAPAASFLISTRSVSDAVPMERIRVTGAGNVGIGTTTPDTRMRVIGKIKVGTETDNTSANLLPQFNDVFELVSQNATSAPAMAFHHRGLHTLQLGSWGSSVTEQGLLLKSGGGEAAAQLHVQSHITSKGGNLHTYRGRLAFSNTPTDSNHTIYNNLSNLDGEGSWDGMKMNVFDGLSIRVGQSASAVPTTALHINGSGNVGIGTISPSKTLEVSGSIAAGGLAVEQFTIVVDATSNGTYAIGSLTNNGKVTHVEFHMTVHNNSTIDALSFKVSLPSYSNGAVYSNWQELPVAFGSSAWNGQKNYVIDVLRSNPAVSGAIFYFRVRNKNGNGSSSNMTLRMSYNSDATFTRITHVNTVGTTFNAGSAAAGGVVDGMYGALEYSFPIAIGQAWKPADNSGLFIKNSGYVGIGTSSPSEMLEVSGSVKAVSYLYTSDARLKKDIITLPDALTKVLQLRGVNFVWRNNNEKTVGFIAQEVEAVYPELVKTDKVSGYKAVQYGNIVAILVEALKQEHEERVRSVANVAEKSEVRMNQLEKENQDLKARLEKLEKFFSEKTK